MSVSLAITHSTHPCIPQIRFDLTTRDFAAGTIIASLRLSKMRKSNSRPILHLPLWSNLVMGDDVSALGEGVHGELKEKTVRIRGEMESPNHLEMLTSIGIVVSVFSSVYLLVVFPSKV